MCEGARSGCRSRGGGGGRRRLPASRPPPPSPRTASPPRSPRFPGRPQLGSAGRELGSSRPSQVSVRFLPSPSVGAEAGTCRTRARLPAAGGFGRMDSAPSGGLGRGGDPAVRSPASGPERPEVVSEPWRCGARRNLGSSGMLGGVDDAVCLWPGGPCCRGGDLGREVRLSCCEGGVVALGMRCANLSPTVW